MGEQEAGSKSEGKVAVLQQLESIAENVQGTFEREKRVLSFEEFLQVFEEAPRRHSRDASTYMLEMIRSYGSETVERATGKSRRYKLFDQSFLDEEEAAASALVGQERVQEAVVRSLENFQREGRANRVLLLHGPNGSAKSTLASCLMRGLEDYSNRDEGALYRFHWVFPKKSSVRGAIGFSGHKRPNVMDDVSYAHFSDEELETKLVVEVRDHPLFLIPEEPRRELLEKVLGTDRAIPRWLTHGTLCHKNQQIFSALLTSYGGALREVLRHIQVERYFLSRRYRVGAVTLGPELSVDAHERQVTADRNLGALPTSLQGLSLFDVGGELVDAGGGLLELSDLLKRPIDAFKYLQITAETGEISLGSQNLQVNCVLLASGNELHLSAFREHPEFESFRGRFELIPAPYLRDHFLEQAIYDRQVSARMKGYVAPHATSVAARFAVLTRLLKPVEENYPETLRPVIKEMTVWTKLLAYAGEISNVEVGGKIAPLKRATEEMAKEWTGSHVYEGIAGASPRTMRGVLFSAAQNTQFSYLSPFAVLDELDELCEKEQDFSFLRLQTREGGFHDHKGFRATLRDWLLDTIEDEVRLASGLVDETRYEELFTKYVAHVSAAVKGERIHNPVTGKLDPPDEGMMRDVEKLLDVNEKQGDARAALMNRIAAWAIDNPGQKLATSGIFREKLAKIRSAVFQERKLGLAKLCKKMLETLGQEGVTPPPEVSSALAVLNERFGYSSVAARDAVARLYTSRLSD